FALLVVTAAGAIDARTGTLVGELRVGRGGRDLDDAFLGIDRRCRDRRTGAEMAGHEDHAFARSLVGHRDSLLRIAGVIADRQDQLLAVHATSRVDILDGLLGATLHLL